eukprot:COSAG02_NODE_21_length_53083_cov_95.733618_2_plen_85_part_00
MVSAPYKRSQAGSGFNTPRSEHNNNFSKNAQKKSSDSRWSAGYAAVLSEFSVLPTTATWQDMQLSACKAARGAEPERARASVTV